MATARLDRCRLVVGQSWAVVGSLGSEDGCGILAAVGLGRSSLVAGAMSCRSCYCSVEVVGHFGCRNRRSAGCIVPDLAARIVTAVTGCTGRTAASSVFHNRCSLGSAEEDSKSRMRLAGLESCCSHPLGSVGHIDRPAPVSGWTLAKEEEGRVCYGRLVAEGEEHRRSSSSEQLALARRG